MKAVVEFGIPQAALPSNCLRGIDSGTGIVFGSAREAARAAAKIAHVLFRRERELGSRDWEAFMPTPDKPRITGWARDRSAWVMVSMLSAIELCDADVQTGE